MTDKYTDIREDTKFRVVSDREKWGKPDVASQSELNVQWHTYLSSYQKYHWSGEWWHTPVIPATWETKVGGAQVWGQPQQLSETTSNLKGLGELGVHSSVEKYSSSIPCAQRLRNSHWRSVFTERCAQSVEGGARIPDELQNWMSLILSMNK